MESKIDVEENLLEHEFDVNLLPVEMLIEIFSYLKHNERLKVALVCKRWFDVARSHRFDLPLKKLVYCYEFRKFINIFNEGSMSLPAQCIKFEIDYETPQITLNQINDIVKQYGHVKIVAKIYVNSAEHFLQLIKVLPEMFKNIIWELYSPSDFQKHWLDICNAVKSKDIEVVIHRIEIWLNPLNKNILSTLIHETPVNNFCIEKLVVNAMTLKGFEPKKLVELLKSLKFAVLYASEPEDIIFFNQVLSPSVTHFTLTYKHNNDNDNTINFLDLLPNLTNVQQIKINIYSSAIPLSLTSRTLNFPKLKKFEFTTGENVLLEYESFKRFVESSPNLEEITLNITYKYSEEQSLMLIENICLFCPFLKKLCILNYVRDNSQSPYLSALNKLQHLESLQMTKFEFQTSILNGLQFSALKELKISFKSMDPEGARMLITAFPNLEKLTLTRPYYKDIQETDTNTVKVLSELQNLKYIRLNLPKGSTEAYTNILKENNPELQVHIYEY